MDDRRSAFVRDLAIDFDRRWIVLTLVAWAAIVAWYLFDDWNRIRWLALGDTDDNMRLAQVRAWMGGQGWYDLRQYRLNPPAGFDIHWSRLVDLPLAGLILFFRLFTSDAWAQKLACGVAPLLPLSLALLGLAATARRLVAPLAWPLAVAGVLFAGATMMMFAPERIDHHGWQLAMLSLTVAGLCDPHGPRGGALVGIASAVSLTIGLEMLPFAGMAGAIIALRWIWQREEAPRLSAYALTLGGGCAAGYAAFASYADRVPRCDALTPVWLSVMVAAGALLFVLAWTSPAQRMVRLAMAVVAGGIIAAGFAHQFPQCLGRPEQVSPELARAWLDNVREAKPIFRHPFRTAFPIAALPVAGLIGACVATWRTRRRLLAEGRSLAEPVMVGWVSVTLFTAFACVALCWQVRFGPGAQMLAVPGAVALVWWLGPLLLNHRSLAVRVFGPVLGFLLVTGLFANLIVQHTGVDRPSRYTQRVNRATGRCMTQPALEPLDAYAKQTVFTFIDLGPRLIVLSHHDAIAGPYHRNGDAMLDVQHAFQGSPDQAHAIMRRHRATLLLVCPNMAESTVYRARAPRGFYGQLAHNRKFAWLTPLPLPRGSPLRLFRIG
ncbi:AcrB/AcrD/AcrF family protein [Sphingomonas bacterium]|uniref:AcrB/AcrD/AcrF family protein n=1 Tax=Sphingomonas bacterium TaxID=1895847 RepID=UPI003F68A413